VVALDRGDEPEQAVRDEVAVVDVCGQAAAEASRDVLDDRRVVEDQAVAERLILRASVPAPEIGDVLGHARRIRVWSETPQRRARARRRSDRPRLPSHNATATAAAAITHAPSPARAAA